MPLVKNPNAPGYILVKTLDEKQQIGKEMKEVTQLIRSVLKDRVGKINIDVNGDGVADAKDIADLAEAIEIKNLKGRKK